MNSRPSFALTALAALLTSACATTGDVPPVDRLDGGIVDLASWDGTPGADSWSADQLVGLEVRGGDGNALGEVENLVIGPDGTVRAMILEVGGFLDIGDTHFRVPWDEVDIDTSGELRHASVPITSGNFERYGAMRTDPASDGPREWRASELLGDYVSLDDAAYRDYGVVNDLIFDADGTLESVVVNRTSTYGGGYYNYPYHGYDAGFDPGLDTYGLPYGYDDAFGLDPFDYGPYRTPLAPL